jgi:hypothetical protein
VLPGWGGFSPTPSMWRAWRSNAVFKRMLLALVVLIMVLWVCSLVSDDVTQSLREQRRERGLAADSRELLVREQQRLNVPDADSLATRPSAANTRLAPARNAKELLSGMRVIVDEVGGRSRYRQAEVEARIAALHLQDLLLPEHLLSEQGLRSGRAVIRRYITLLNYSLAINRISQAELEQRLRALAAELPEGRAVIASHDRNAARGLEEDNALLNNQRVAIGKIERIYALAEARRGQVQLRDNALIFERQSDANEYNRLVRDIQALAEQRSAIYRYQQARVQAELDEIGKLRRR